MKVRTKIFSTLLFSSLSLLLLASGIFYTTEKKALQQQVFNQLQSIASLQQARLASIIDQNNERLKLVASRTQLRISLEKYLNGENKHQHKAKMARILTDAKSSIEDFRDIHIYSIEGKIIVSTAKTDLPDSIKFERNLLEHAQSLSSADTLLLDSKNDLLLLLTGPLSLNGNLLGTIIIESDVKNIIASVSNFAGLGETGEIVIAKKSEKGDALFLFPTRFDPKASLTRSMSKQNIHSPLIKGLSQQSDIITMGIDYRDRAILAVTKHLDLADWTILVKIDKSEAFSAIENARRLITIVTISLILLSIIIAFVLSQNITKPISYLTEIAKEISSGNLLAEIKESSNDEIGELTHSFNEMITSLNSAQQALKESQIFLEKIVDNMPNMVFVKDAKELRFLRFNKAGEELLGCDSKDLLGKNDYDFFPKEEADFFTKKDKEVLAKKELIDIPEEPIQTKDKGTRILHTKKIPILDENGEPLFLLGISEDITGKQQTEQELFKIKKLESVGVLAGGIAHDFNNILSAILGNINLALFDETLNDRTKKLLSEAEKASLRAKDLTQQLLTFAKGGEPVKETFSLENVIKDSANFVLHGDKVACRFDFSTDLWLVDIDKGQIGQVIQNTVLNSSHAMPDGGVINVSCENVFLTDEQDFPKLQKGRFVKISIEDSGIGIPAKIIEKIFDPYFSTKQEGSGLGLAISQSIINKHGGHLSVKSKLGEGTTFTIYLPASEQTKTQDQKSDVYEIKSTQAKILIMDDEDMVRTVAKEMLTQLGHDVLLAKSGEEAIKLYKESINENNKFNLVLMDLTIPGGMGGEEAVKEILAIDPDAKVIVSSGYSNDPIMANFKDYGFCSAIVKPFKLQELSSVIGQIHG